MTRINPPIVAQPDTAPRRSAVRSPPREPARLRTDHPEVVILGFPSDEGVRRNGGQGRRRAGPAPPFVPRSTASRADPRSEQFEELLGRTRDLGDLEISRYLEADQQHLGEALAPYLERGAFVIVLGGGHETSYGHFLGYARAGRRSRSSTGTRTRTCASSQEGKAHSGSPFRQAIEDPSGACRRYSVAGAAAPARSPGRISTSSSSTGARCGATR